MYPKGVWQALLLPLLVSILGICTRSAKQVSCLLLAICLGVAAGLCTVARTTHTATALYVDTYAAGESVEIRGVVAAEPDRRPMQTKYTVAIQEIHTQSGGSIYPVIGKVLATDTSGWPEYEYGDTVLVRGILEIPGNIETFQYDKYLQRYGIYSVMYRAGFTKIQGATHFSVRKKLFAAKDTFESQINRLYAEPYASFMAGLLTGSRRGIPKHLLEDFNTTGLTHIIAISGYNITIVIVMISGMLFWLPLKIRFFPAIIAIVGFTLFVGASAAVVRASIMGILGLLALQTGRQSEVRLTVLWTLALMLAWNPKYLWYDAGFQLSFLAVIGLIEIAPLLDTLFSRVPQILGIREALQMTVAAQLSAVPLIVFLFGRLSLIAPVANLAVAPFIPLAMLFGFVGTLLSFLWFPLGQLVAYIGWGCLEWIVLMANTLANLPMASIDTGNMRIYSIVLYYSLLSLPLVHAQFALSRKPRN
jgi:competence protein ComEC